jgi:glycosyltransferase involved in cell wall biosynthesis
MRLSVVVPCYKSAPTIATLLSRIEAALNELVSADARVHDYEVIVVVDGSPDDTVTIARTFEASMPALVVLELQRNFGQHNALIAGIRRASGDIIVTMDDDLQHHPEDMGLVIDPVLNGDADLVYAVALVEEHGWMRSFASRTVKRALGLSGVPNASNVGSFRAFRTELREGFSSVTDPFVILDVLLSWTTSRVQTVKVSMSQREVGRSSYSFPKLVLHTFNMVTGYGVAPLRAAMLLGFLAGALGFVLLVVVLVQYWVGNTTVQGFTTISALVSLFAGVQLITIGIIGEYLGRLHFRTMNKPMYVIRPTGAAPSE